MNYAKFILRLPGLALAILCGLLCMAIGWEGGEEFCAAEYERLQGRL